MSDNRDTASWYESSVVFKDVGCIVAPNCQRSPQNVLQVTSGGPHQNE
jgi:hypothetical protein